MPEPWPFQPDGTTGPLYTGSGSDLPATVDYTYPAAGTCTAVFSVDDGSAATDANATITAA